MALRPVDNWQDGQPQRCMTQNPIVHHHDSTILRGDPSSLQYCRRNISSSPTSYPSCTTGPNSTATERYCYVVSNYDSAGMGAAYARMPLVNQAMTDCCGKSGPGSYQSCVNFCATDRNLEEFKSCLASKGVGPTCNDTGIMRDTYCVRKSLDDGRTTIVKDAPDASVRALHVH